LPLHHEPQEFGLKKKILTMAVGAALGIAGFAAIFGLGSTDVNLASNEEAQRLWLGAPK